MEGGYNAEPPCTDSWTTNSTHLAYIGTPDVMNFPSNLMALELIDARDSLYEVRQLVQHNNTILKDVATRASALRASYPKVIAPESIFEVTADTESIFGAATSTIGAQEFDFDDVVINSQAYRRVLAAARRNMAQQEYPHAIPDGDLIDLSEPSDNAQGDDRTINRELRSLKFSTYNEPIKRQRSGSLAADQPPYPPGEVTGITNLEEGGRTAEKGGALVLAIPQAIERVDTSVSSSGISNNGVLTMATRCYSPSCFVGRSCYTITCVRCPHRLYGPSTGGGQKIATTMEENAIGPVTSLAMPYREDCDKLLMKKCITHYDEWYRKDWASFWKLENTLYGENPRTEVECQNLMWEIFQNEVL